jgi:endonuclease/exonuclease/phosphatase family metal-dependent hydrolase
VATFDAVALALPVVVALAVVALVAAALLLRHPVPVGAALSWLAFGAVVVVGPWAPVGGAPPRPGMRVAEANLLGNRGEPAVADILGRHPDLVVVSELGSETDRRLRAAFPAAARSPSLEEGIDGDVGLYSRWPVTAGPLPGPLASQRGLRAVVDGPAGRFVVYALHLVKPDLSPKGPTEVSFGTYRRLVDQVRAAVRAEALPTVVAGDLNLVDRTSAYRRLTRDLADAARADWMGPTSFRRPLVPLLARVDQVLMPKTWCSTDAGTFHLTGSDHRGVAVTLGPC